ncbi:MAG: hypothetical protein U0350_40100 [Caldilineaceae bacterium]
MTHTQTKSSNKSLATIASDMKADLRIINWTRRKLTNGLEILIERQPGSRRYRLACAREVHPPSDIELRILLSAFGLPPTTQWVRSEKGRRIKRMADDSERIYLNALHIAECTWGEP